uniref:Large ribosomal subunit protein uL23c n=1 Tax=Vaginularia trichoidea TaxID=474354 RepID=A0A3G5CTU0_9MONI|nr:ribosomal protein L23 [Vaginularia trichoidea]AYW16116.1 ribosomal protein L23 [Vaginularia trichoidea]
MGNLKNQIISEKSIRLIKQNQYTFRVDSILTKTEMKNQMETLFDVKVEDTNSISVRKKSWKKGTNSNLRHSKKMIIKLKENYSIPYFLTQN